MLSGSYTVYYTQDKFDVKFEWTVALLLIPIFGQAIYVAHRLRMMGLEQSQLHYIVSHERDEYKSILASLPEGVLIARAKSPREQREEQDHLYMHLDDQLAGRRFIQPFETRFISKQMTNLLNDVNKVDHKTQNERKVIDSLNKKKDAELAKKKRDKYSSQHDSEKKKNKSFDEMKTYDSKFSLKIFKLIGVDPMSNHTESKRTCNYSTGAEHSITDILSEQWKGKRIYTVNLRRKGSTY